MNNYENFANKEIQNLIYIQNKFKENFNLDYYENWFYDSETELLRLYNSDDDEIFFKYIPIGTFSIEKQTWMWSWFNNYLTEKNKEKTMKIKNFGVKNNYEKLIEGTFPSDEYDGWKFSAIGVKLLGGIGIYKINLENLNYYLLLTEVSNDSNLSEIKKFKQKKVDCNSHGFSRPAFVCQHLNLESPKGFHEAFETQKGMDLDDEEDFQAWCDDCEKIRIKYDGWNENSETFAKIKLICENCYFDLKNFNIKI